jgi:hypothetical protein
MMTHFAHWFFKWFFTIGTAWSFVNMVKTVNRPLATRSIVVGRKRFRKTQLDNVMDGVGAIYGLIFFAAIAGVLWLS